MKLIISSNSFEALDISKLIFIFDWMSHITEGRYMIVYNDEYVHESKCVCYLSHKGTRLNICERCIVVDDRPLFAPTLIIQANGHKFFDRTPLWGINLIPEKELVVSLYTQEHAAILNQLSMLVEKSTVLDFQKKISAILAGENNLSFPVLSHYLLSSAYSAFTQKLLASDANRMRQFITLYEQEWKIELPNTLRYANSYLDNDGKQVVNLFFIG